MKKVIGLLGAYEVGKDYCSDKLAAAGIVFEKIGMADPMYDICNSVFGSCDKNKPGVRRFLQMLGQIGAGRFSDAYPMNVESASLILHIRQYWHDLTEGKYPGTTAKKFGLSESFWSEIAVYRVRTSHAPVVVIPNVRFEVEEELVRFFNGDLYIVSASDESLTARRKRQPSTAELSDISEQLWAKRLGALPVIWNDDLVKKPLGFLSVEEFVEQVKKGIQ